MSDFGPPKKVSVYNSVIVHIFKNVLVITNGHNHQLSECFVKNVKKCIFWHGEGVVRKLGQINEGSLNFQMDGALTKFYLFEIFLYNELVVHCIII